MMLPLPEKPQIIVENKLNKKMRKKLLVVVTLFSTMHLVQAQDDNTVLSIADEHISLTAFQSVFSKNNHDVELTKEYLDEYMELFINFKLKVKEAQDLGLDTLPAFINELAGYKKQLAKPYLKDDNFNANMLKESYDRMQYDINASHILIAVSEKATHKETQEALNKINSIRNQIISGSLSFSDAAKKYSADKSAAHNGGNLGYFTAFRMVYEFENAAYNTEVGAISTPVKTKYGYHIIQVNDKRKAVGEVRVAHIMFKTGQGASQKKQDEAKKKILQVADLLAKGEEFADVAERYSEDRSTAVKGGKLPPFGVGKMVPEFERVAFSLTEIGTISEVFKTEYGWHILYLLERKDIASFETIKEELKQKIAKDSRGRLSEQALIEKLKAEYTVKEYADRIAAIEKAAAGAIEHGNWDAKNATYMKRYMFKIEQQVFTQKDFIAYILDHQMVGSDVNQLYQEFFNASLVAYEESRLSLKYPEYKALLQEYNDGILLFDLTNKKVWNKAVEDTVGLEAYYQDHKNEYMWNERVEAAIYTCIDLNTARKVKSLIHRKRRGTITNEEILNKINDVSPLNLQVEEGKFAQGANPYTDQIDWKEGISKDIKGKNGSFIIVDITQILAPQLKELEETKGKVISDYQNALEQEWVNNLRNKFPVTVNKEILYSIIK